jgi:hypothetical protein
MSMRSGAVGSARTGKGRVERSTHIYSPTLSQRSWSPSSSSRSPLLNQALPAAAKAKSNGGDRPAIVADARSDLPVDAAAGTSEQASELDIEEAKRRWLAADEQHKEIARTAMRGCVMVDEIVNENLRKGYPAGIMTAYKKTAHAIGRSKDSVRRDYGRAMRFPSEYRVMALTPGWNLQERSSQIKRAPELSRAIVQKIIMRLILRTPKFPRCCERLEESFQIVNCQASPRYGAS